MSGNPGQGFPYQYNTGYGSAQGHEADGPQQPTVQSGLPQYSLDFLDVSAHYQPLTRSATVSPAGAIYLEEPTSPINELNRTWSGNTYGHHRNTSDANIDYDEVDEDEQDDGSQGLQSPAFTSAEAAMAKRKMKRFRLTHNQTRFLMDEFLKQPHPDANHREYLSKLIPGLSPRQVQIWFQNRRAKLKRLSTDDRERLMQQRRSMLEIAKDARRTQTPGEGSMDAIISASAATAGVPQPSTASLFARAYEQASAGPSNPPVEARSIEPNVPSSNGSGRRRKSKAHRENALVFGWDISVYVDDSGSELEDDGASIVSSERSHEDEVESTAERVHRRHVPMLEVGVPASREDIWSMPPLPRGADTIAQQPALRRASVQEASNSDPRATVQQRPAYTSTPSWPAPSSYYGGSFEPAQQK